MRRRVLRACIVLVLCAPLLVWTRLASGIGADDFSGWDMGAKATAVAFVFDSPSLGIPASPSGELNLAFSEATLQSGPAAYGLGSSAWPGQVVAALPAFLQAEIETQAGQEFFPVDVPNYPIRAESFFPQGPTSASLDAGTIHMRSSAREVSSEGVSYLNTFQIPGIMSIGNQSSFAQNGFDQDGAVSMVEAAATDLRFLAGLIQIDSVVTRATSRSDGEKGSVAGGTTVVGATIEGIGDVVIDTEGVRVAEQGLGAGALQQQLNGVLNQAGVTIQLSEPVDTIEGPKGSRALGGLLISVRTDTLEPLIAALPDDLQTQIRGQLTLDQQIMIQVAPAVVSTGAVRKIDFGGTGGDVVDPVADGAGDVIGDLPAGDAGGGGGAVIGGGGSTGAGGGFASGVPPTEIVTVQTSFEGVPVWLVVLLMILAFVSSRPLTAMADRVFARRGGAVACPDAQGPGG